MAKYLVIVESPAKVKTIKKFLGANYEVAASNGHVRDLPKSQLGFDAEHDFEPKYITIRGKGDILASLRKSVKKAEKVYLATDPDREGEAISWHLLKALKLEDKKVYRITFNEITKNAIKESLKHAREIDMDLVDAQQARRMVDRMVGYRISPLLWAKIKRGLSAGRVQSVALRLICDRDEEINAFLPEEYWTLDVNLKADGEKKPFTAKYYGTEDGKRRIASKEEMDTLLAQLNGATYRVTEVKRGERVKKAPQPFITSTLQQEASKTLNYSTQKTMRLAQQLYEGLEIKGEGTVGLITYLRTDSTRISEEAKTTALDYIAREYGAPYALQEGELKKTTTKIQDAHEAIRPTDLSRLPVMIKDQIPRDLYRLYQLIWKRFVASRMSAAVYETISVKIKANNHLFTLAASKLQFPGFTMVYSELDDAVPDEKARMNVIAGSLNTGMELEYVEQEPKQHFTAPPPHYNEASLVKALEELGIGRPSTYAPTITTIMARRYVAKENKNLYVTELGEVVNHMMKKAFPTIVDVNFTATMEALLDDVEMGNVPWKSVVSNFYPDLDEAVKKAQNELDEIKIEDEVTEELCPQCGKNMVIKYGPHGRFLACPGFPDCRSTKPYFEKIGVLCPKCGNDIVIKKTKKGRRYFGCSNYPDCDFMVWQKPSNHKCPDCGQMMLEKGNFLVCMNDECKKTIEAKEE
ncbi:MAG: type I DNA topoisomerase [Lachnospiraceae bacterium]|jgi:DNA topoisomerase-1|nr:type I DNA topoisomerase [Lachnospiraceae bacterium]